MGIPRSSPAQADSDKLLWTVVAVVVILVLAMGITLMRLQAQPQKPQAGVLPAAAPPSAAPPVLASAATEPARSAASVPPATTTTDPVIEINKPRIVHPRTSEPAVARAPQRVASRPDAAEGDPAPDVNR